MGSMGIEGAVQLAYRKEAEAISDATERKAYLSGQVQRLYADGRAMNVASYMEIDDVIDPAETRKSVIRAFNTSLPSGKSAATKMPIDAW
jgi:acetyl-CoA carboxylase carboxyltransferase component